MKKYVLATALVLWTLARGAVAQEPQLPSPDAPVLTVPTEGCLSTQGWASCNQGERWWGGAEYLLWWVKDGPLPPLATTTNDLTDPRRGSIDLASTTVLYGNNGAGFD